MKISNYSSYESMNHLHRKAEQAREEDRHVDALKLIDRAILDYQKEKNFEGLSRVLQSRVLTYKHIFLLTKDKKYIDLAKHDAEISLEIAKKHNLLNVISSCYFRLGEVAMLLKDYKSAIKNYQLALDNYAGTNAEKGDYRYHLGEAIYRNGDRNKGKEIILKGLKEIQNNSDEVDPFLTHVWESGCYMKLAELLKDVNGDEARGYLTKAQTIANSDNKLVIRRRQIETLSKLFE